MSVIAPAVLTENNEQYQQYMQTVQGFAERVHIDITDGEFAPTFTISENDMFWPQNVQADIHAMVARPSEHVQQIAAKKPHMIIFHAEASEDLARIIQYVHQCGIKAGIALQRQTVPDTVAPLIEMVDHVMIFSGDLGHYGGTASLMQLEKVRLIRNIQPNVEVGWDGGANLENVFSLAQGGVNVVNCGGAINNQPDAAAAYKQLTEELNKHSVI